jgi:hypothetical protein
MRNTKIREELNIFNLNNQILESKRRIVRMEDRRIPKKMFADTSVRRRNIGTHTKDIIFKRTERTWRGLIHDDDDDDDDDGENDGDDYSESYPPLVSILNQINPVHTPQPISLTSILIIPHQRLGLICLFPSAFPTKVVHVHLFVSMLATFPAHLVLLG